MSIVVRAFPVLPGRETLTREFAAAVCGPRRQEAAAFYQQFGISRETWHLQETGDGKWVIVVTEIDQEPKAAGQVLAQSTGVFERWFKDQVKQLSGIDQDTQPLGPPTEMILYFDPDEEAPVETQSWRAVKGRAD